MVVIRIPEWTNPYGFLSVDPGKRMGWAAFGDGHLIVCGLTDGDRPTFGSILTAPLLVIERPHEGESKASKGDLITLGRRMGAAQMVSKAPTVIEVLPNRWKGTVPKEFKAPTGEKFYPAWDMIWSWMKESERWIFQDAMRAAATKRPLGRMIQYNCLDAIGLGIWYARSVGLR